MTIVFIYLVIAAANYEAIKLAARRNMSPKGYAFPSTAYSYH